MLPVRGCRVTLTELVLPTGGVKEKAPAVRRSGIRHVILTKAFVD